MNDDAVYFRATPNPPYRSGVYEDDHQRVEVHILELAPANAAMIAELIGNGFEAYFCSGSKIMLLRHTENPSTPGENDV